MTWNQIDLVTRKVLVLRSKGGVDGTMRMSSRLYDMLKRRSLTAVDQYVFPTKRRNNNNFVWLRKAQERAGIRMEAGKVTLHTARHTFASRMLQNGLSLVEVKQLLGHKNIQSTMVYSHVETGAVAEKAARILSSY